MNSHQITAESRSSEFRPFNTSPVPHLFYQEAYREASPAFAGRKAALSLVVLVAAWLVLAAVVVGSLPEGRAETGSPAAGVRNHASAQALQPNVFAAVATAFGSWFACRGETCGVDPCMKPALCEVPQIPVRPMAQKRLGLLKISAFPGFCLRNFRVHAACRWYGLDVV